MLVEPPALEGALEQPPWGVLKEIVKKQADVGVDVLNDGEQTKPSYATYVKDRLSGFGGKSSLADGTPAPLIPTRRPWTLNATTPWIPAPQKSAGGMTGSGFTSRSGPAPSMR